MKRTFLLILGLFLSLNHLIAQFGYEISGGLNTSTVHYENYDVVDPEFRNGYFFGFRPKYSINDKIDVGLDVQFSVKGFEIKTENAIITDIYYKFYYTDLIPEIDYKITKLISIGIGGNVGIRTGEKIKFSDDDWIVASDNIMIKSLDIGITGNIKANLKYISLFFRYNRGLKDVNNLIYTDFDGNILDNVKFRNTNLQIGASFDIMNCFKK